MPKTRIFEFEEILRILSKHRARFLVVGGVSAVLNGAPVSTFDLDVVHARDEENIEPLLGAIEELEAHYRAVGPRHIVPNRSHLVAPGHQLLTTKFGDLDLLGTIDVNLGFEDLVPKSELVTVEENLEVLVLNLETLIEIKQRAGRPKDLNALPTLRGTLKEKRRATRS